MQLSMILTMIGSYLVLCFVPTLLRGLQMRLAINKVTRKMSLKRSIATTVLTRKLSYRKDDRAMRPMYECPEKFWEFLTTPMANFLNIFNGLLFRLSL